MKARQQLKAFLLRHGRIYAGKTSWSKTHARWLTDQSFEQAASKRDVLHLETTLACVQPSPRASGTTAVHAIHLRLTPSEGSSTLVPTTGSTVATSVTHLREGIMERSIRRSRRWLLALGFGVASAMSTAPLQAQEMCGGQNYPFPYTDVSGVGTAFCPGIMEAYVTGVSKGTTPTTFSPNNTVTRVQMTTFLQRSLDQGLARTSRRAALNQWWTTQDFNATLTIDIGVSPYSCAADGENIWTAASAGAVAEVQGSTGIVLGTWSGAASSVGTLVAGGRVYLAGETSPGNLYVIDPTQVPGSVGMGASTLGDNPVGIAFDGTHVWTANCGGSVSIITPQASFPYPVTNVTTGFNTPYGILYDGAHIWVTDQGAGTLLELDPGGAILRTVTVGTVPGFPVFDGTNIWVPNQVGNSITVVQASTGSVVATIGADVNNHLSFPTTASFDGERILVTNQGGNTVTLFKAADLSFIANVTTGASTQPFGACSDGVNFWITLLASDKLVRF
jgi:DNA-binding beta-propeller fold protein YncE